MGRNNHNAGMHFVKYGCNVYELYGYDRYADVMSEHMLRKSQEKKKEETKEKTIDTEVDNTVITTVKKIERNMSIDKYYDDACKQADRIYSMLFLCAIKHHSNLKEISRRATEYIKGKTTDGSVDDMVFLSMTSKMIGMNLGHLVAISDDEIKDLVYNNILVSLDEYSIKWSKHSDDADYIEAGLSLIDYSKENDIRYYYMFLKEAVSSDQMEMLPDIYSHFELTFYRIKDENNENEYAVAISISDHSNDNYLNWYEAIVYTEKSGLLADFFEKTFREYNC